MIRYIQQQDNKVGKAMSQASLNREWRIMLRPAGPANCVHLLSVLKICGGFLWNFDICKISKILLKVWENERAVLFRAS